MTIQWTVAREQQTGLQHKSVFVLLHQDGVYREYEITRVSVDRIVTDDDVLQYAQQRGISADMAWNAAAPRDADRVRAWLVARQARTDLLVSIATELTWLDANAPASTTVEALALVNRLAAENVQILRVLRWMLNNDSDWS